MNILIKITIFVFFLPFFAWARINEYEEIKRERMLGDLEFIRNIFQTSYAPAKWKKTYANWDFDIAIDGLREQVVEPEELTTKQFQQLVKVLFNSAKDYHVAVHFYSTEAATLPFRIQSANDKYFFSSINYSKLQKGFPFIPGDELVLMDGLPIKQLIEELREREIGFNNDSTDLALAQFYLTTRLGSLGHQVPQGIAALTGRRMGENTLIECQIEWKHAAEKINNLIAPKRKEKKHSTASFSKGVSNTFKIGQHSFFKKRFQLPQYQAISAIAADESAHTDILGSRKSYIPLLGELIWRSPEDSIFDSYLFKMPNGKVGGYIRIGAYDLEDPQEASIEFASHIKKLQQSSDALVIDQINNPGGYVLYMYALASMLSDKPLAVPKHRMMITQEDVYFAAKELSYFDTIDSDEEARDLLGNALMGIPVNRGLLNSLKGFAEFILNEWNQGRQFTLPLYLYGIGPIPPHPVVNYTKPILLLINSLDFSAADFLPAILQDNHRATLLGTRTAGAGGHLASVNFPNLSGISEFQYTASIAERADHNLIENFGVTPDVFYNISETDLQNEYCEYAEAILRTLESLIKPARGSLWKFR